MKKILIYSLNYYPEMTGIGKYNCEFAEHLADNGIDVTVLCALPYYPEWKIPLSYKSWKFSQEIINGVNVIRCPLFVPKQPNTLSRLIHLLSFSLTSAVRLFFLSKRNFNAVFLVQPTLFCVPQTLFFCKVFGARSILHIQDFELDAMLGLGMMKQNFLVKQAFKLETYLLKKFDLVSTISNSMLEKVKNKGRVKLESVLFPNWANISSVKPNVSASFLREQLGILVDDRVVLYSGNIGNKQGIEVVLEAACELKSVRNLIFLLVGNGAYVSKLKVLARELKLDNVIFSPLLSSEKLPALLSMAHIHLVIQKRNVADSVLPSKLTNILAVGGNAIVTAEKQTELGKIAEMYPGIYRLIPPEDSSSLTRAISEFLSQDKVINNTARSYALKNLDKNAVLSKYLDKLKELG